MTQKLEEQVAQLKKELFDARNAAFSEGIARGFLEEKIRAIKNLAEDGAAHGLLADHHCEEILRIINAGDVFLEQQP